MSQLSFLYTTFPTQDDAVTISQKLLEMGLIACANILGEIRSLYMWDGSMEDNQEIAVLLKTTSQNIPELMARLQELHPYETPAILEMPINHANESFIKWVQECMR